MIRFRFISFLFIAIAFLSLQACTAKAPGEEAVAVDKASPNIVVFYIDDLGYGDLGCYGATDLPTPNVDKLASQGIRFTDAHCSSATCTPSRYSLLTGEHAFRRKAAVLPGDAPLLIPTDKPTLPRMLQSAGYATGVVGKWHLGLGDGSVDWNQEIKPGPLEVGFDYCYLIPATGDRVPTVYVENHRVVNLAPDDQLRVSYDEKIGDAPTGLERPELLRYAADEQHAKTIVNGISRIGYQAGGTSANWRDEDFPDTLGLKAKEFIRKHQKEPFFLFYSFHDIHVPRLPHPRFKGKTTMGWRGDAIVQMDWMVGDLLAEIESLGLSENTLIVFTSDNGPVLDDGYADKSVTLLGNHQPAGPYRGGKYSAFEAGTRVPLIVKWAGKIAPNSSSAALVSQIDLFATVASWLGIGLAANAAIDSENQGAAWLGSDPVGRKQLVEESFTLSLRQGNWKYIKPHQPNFNDWITERKQIESGFSAEPQLYNLAGDPEERENVQADHPDLVAEMAATVEAIEQRFSRPD